MKTKIRGLRRKCLNMVTHISEETAVFPGPHWEDAGYWHLHLPIADNLIDSAKNSFGVRRLCVQTLITRAHHLASIAPVGETSTRVVVAIDLPRLFGSQIIVFFGSDYFDTFFNRDTDSQRWTPLEANRSLVREWNLQIPSGFSEHGYHEEINDLHEAFGEPDVKHSGEVWFVGQLPATAELAVSTLPFQPRFFNL